MGTEAVSEIPLEEFEAGENVTDQFASPKRPSGIVISVRLDPQDADRLVDHAEATGRTLSQVGREAIRDYLRYGLRSGYEPELTISASDGVSLFVRTNARGPSTEGCPVRLSP